MSHKLNGPAYVGVPAPWWDKFKIPVAIAAGLTACSTMVVATARYIDLPKGLEAAQQKNVEQDAQLTELRIIQGQNERLLTQQTAMMERLIPSAPPSAPAPLARPALDSSPQPDRVCIDERTWKEKPCR